MLYKNSEFLFRTPLTFFGSFEQFNAEFEDDEECFDLYFPSSLNPSHPAKQITGLYLQWHEFEL